MWKILRTVAVLGCTGKFTMSLTMRGGRRSCVVGKRASVPCLSVHVHICLPSWMDFRTVSWLQHAPTSRHMLEVEDLLSDTCIGCFVT